jgi:hypothetical protein
VITYKADQMENPAMDWNVNHNLRATTLNMVSHALQQMSVAPLPEGEKSNVSIMLEDIPVYAPRSVSDNESIDVEDSCDLDLRTHCRYCWERVEKDHSLCNCNSALCKECLRRELSLTESRGENVMKCTVCLYTYTITVQEQKKIPKLKLLKFGLLETCICRTSQYQGPRRGNIYERIGFFCIFAFLTAWLICTTYTVLYPSPKTFEPGKKYTTFNIIVYGFLIFMDWTVSFSVGAFVSHIRCMKMSLFAYLGTLYGSRFFYMLFGGYLIKIRISKFVYIAEWLTLTNSLLVGVYSYYRYWKMIKHAWSRHHMRHQEIMVGPHGPFLLVNGHMMPS